ncbi:hypothetical protein SH449x_000163 [Pirellulaceae bacterium SH449]
MNQKTQEELNAFSKEAIFSELLKSLNRFGLIEGQEFDLLCSDGAIRRRVGGGLELEKYCETHPSLNWQLPDLPESVLCDSGRLTAIFLPPQFALKVRELIHYFHF